MKVIFKGILTIDLALEAVKQKGYALRYVPAAVCTEAVALEAVKQDGDALQYVLNLDLFIKIAATLNIYIEK